MVRKQGNLTVEENTANLNIDNGRIKLRLYLRDGGYVQEFYAKDRTGYFQLVLSSLHKALIPSSEHRVGASPMISGDRPHLFGVCRESLRMVYSEAQITEHTPELVTVRLSGNVQGHALNCNITLTDNADHFHVAVDDTITAEDDIPLVEYVMSAFTFLPAEWVVTNSRPVDYTWAPILRPKKSHVIGDNAFSSPAVIVQQDSCAAALIPDLRTLEFNRPLPTVLDLDISNGLLFAPLLSYGFCGYERTSDGCFTYHDVTMSKRLDPAHLSYAYDLLIYADCKRKLAHRDVSRFLWTNYGAPAIRKQQSREYSVKPTPAAPAGALQTDPHTQTRYQTGWDALKPAQKSLAQYRSTGARTHLEQGMQELDEACLLQSVWALPWADDPLQPGALAASNVDQSADPLLTAEFARVAMRYGALTGESYYFERGTAALMAALNAKGLDPETQAKIDECAESIRSDYGSVYIHLGRKWGACTAGARISKLDFTRGGVSLDFVPVSSGIVNGHRRVVFGGLRGKSYTVCIDGHTQTCTREQMEAGLLLPAPTPPTPTTSTALQV